MATLRDTLKNTLEADSTLMALLTGGVWDADDVFQEGMSAANAPREADNVTIKPFASVRWGAAIPDGPETVEAEVQSVEIYVYQPYGYATINAALARIKYLLNRQMFYTDDCSLAYFNRTHKGGDFKEADLGQASGRFIRFGITQIEA